MSVKIKIFVSSLLAQDHPNIGIVISDSFVVDVSRVSCACDPEVCFVPYLAN
jgi:hypothetical protein